MTASCTIVWRVPGDADGPLPPGPGSSPYLTEAMGDARYAPIGGTATVFTKIAGAVLGGHRVVWIDTDDQAYYADNAQPSADRVAGITTGAAAAAALATIQLFGEITEPSWAWVPGPVFLGSTGLLTQVAPVIGAMTQVGVATAPTKLLVRVEPAIVLA